MITFVFKLTLVVDCTYCMFKTGCNGVKPCSKKGRQLLDGKGRAMAPPRPHLHR